MGEMPVILILHSLPQGFSLWEQNMGVAPADIEQASESRWRRPASV